MIMNGECGSFSPRILECFQHVKEAFADLSREYADGRSLKTDYSKSHLGDTAVSTVEDEQLKYLTLLRYVDSTVMEADFSNGTYRVSYIGGKDFEALCAGDSFEDAIRNFVGEAVHPDDREMVLELVGGYVKDFFRDGINAKSRKYRILNRETGGYYWCKATILRMDLHHPRAHKAMFIWHKDDDRQESEN